MEVPESVQTNPLDKKSNNYVLLSKIVPVTGCISYEIFSSNILLPKRFSGFFGSRDLIAADALWFNAHIGIGLYIYKQRLLQRTSTPWRITYSVFGTTLFNFGSVLMWGTSKALLPKTPEGLKLIFGLSSGLALLYIGKTYLEFIDSVLPKDDEMEDSNIETTA